MTTDNQLSVCGAGVMGSQIALLGALHGYQVNLFDINATQLELTLSQLKQLMQRKVEKGRLPQADVDDAFSRLSSSTNLAEAVRDADVVIEAIVEKLPVKRDLFAQLSQLTSPDTLLATNSSSIVSSKLADVVDHPERLCNVHFFNPALVMQLVEVVQGPHTSDATVEKAMSFARDVGKTPIHIKQEIFGFVVNRILAAIFDEAIFLHESGIASIEDIDIATTKGLNHPIGPFALLDMTGIDVNYDIKVMQANDAGDPSQGPSATLKSLYDQGKLGRKTGTGFYNYESTEEPNDEH